MNKRLQDNNKCIEDKSAQTKKKNGEKISISEMYIN